MMSEFLERILNALDSRPWRLVLEKQGSAVLLAAFKGKRSVSFHNLLARYPPARQISAFLHLDGKKAVVPLRLLAQTRQVLRDLESDSLKIDMSPEVGAFRVLDVPPDFVVSYAWSEAARCIERQVGKEAIYCGSGWFVSGNSGWCVAEFGAVGDSWLYKATISGQAIITLLRHTVPSWQGRGLPIVCTLKYSNQPVVILEIRHVSDDFVDCAVTWNAPASAICAIPSLTDHVLVDGIVRPGVSPALLGKHVPTDSGPFRISAQQIPLFHRDTWPHVQPWATGALATLKEKHRVLTSPGMVSLLVEPVDRRGMSIVHATPIFTCEGISQSAELISRQLDSNSEFLRFPGGWVSAQIVRQAGIGPLGRLTDGTPMAPITLTAVEVLKRGSSRLDGPWARVDFPALALPDSGVPLETARAHLDFLHRWRIPGGLIGDLRVYQGAFLTLLVDLASKQAGLKMLVVASKKDLDRLAPAWVRAVAARFEGTRQDPQAAPMPRGVLLATPKAVESISELTKTRWDLLCILGADTLIKTPNSNFYRQLNPCHRTLTIGLFSSRHFLKRLQAREALSQMFRVPAGENGDLLWRYGLRDPQQKPPPLPSPYQVQPKSRATRPGIRPVEVAIGSPAKRTTAVPIPARPLTTRPTSAPSPQKIAVGNTGIHIEIRYSTGDDQFVAAAHAVVDKHETRARFIPFHCYWPTYSSMTTEQKQWYFYWRAQVREGRYPDTDLSYIFLHVYELINNVGVRNADDGYERLRQIWRNYRDRFPKLDHYLIDWMADYAAIYQPDVAPLAVYAEALALNARVSSVDLVLPSYLAQPLSQLPVPVIEALSNYQLRRSKFYTGGYRDTLQKGVPAAVESVDNYMRQHLGGGIFDLFSPNTTVAIRRQAFQSGRYAGNARSIILGTAVPFSQHPPLKDFMTAVVKHAENTLRRQAGYTGKLYGYTLETEIRAAIEVGLGIVQPVESKAPARPQVQIDLARVQALTSESNQVRDRLLADMQSGAAEPAPPLAASEPAVVAGPIESPKGLLTDLQPVHTILTRLSASETKILVTLLQSGGQMNAPALAQAMPDILLEAGIDRINNLALANLGDLLIAEEAGVKTLTDDYRDELEYLLLQNAQLATTEGVPIRASQLPSEWVAFSDRLADHQLAILEAIVGQGDVPATIRLIAEANATMPGALLDSINEIAMDTLSDIIIDTAVDPPVIEDEDIEMVRHLLTESAANQQ
jgi:hypothetical protein